MKHVAEVRSIIVETRAANELFPKLCLELEKLGFKDIHKKALESICSNLKDMLNVDLMSRASFRKKVRTPRPHIFIDLKTRSVVALNEPERKEFVTGETAFEVTCFSETQYEADSLVENLKKLLEQRLGKDAIHDGDFDENCDKHLIRSLLETRRGALIGRVSQDIIRVFAQSNASKALRRLAAFPIKFFSRDMFTLVEQDELYEFDPQSLASLGILEEKFSFGCKTCENSSSAGTPIFDSKKDASSALQKKSMLCPNCANRLTSESATIQSYFRFTDLGLECAKGLWLEGYIRSILEELGVKGNMMKCCAIHGKDELDVVFSYYGDLYICECKDRVVGRNDVYVLAMKASRINEDEKIGTTVNKVLVVSTEPISKDIISTALSRKENAEPKYLFVSGGSEAIRKEILKVARKAKQRYKREKIKQLSQLLLDCLPPTQEEIEERFFEQEEEL